MTSPVGDELGRITDGGYFGELALVQECTRQATIQAGDDKCVLIEVPRHVLRAVLIHEPKANAEIDIRILGRNCLLTSVLTHDEGWKLFKAHLKKEFSEENGRFWHAVHNFQQTYSRLGIEGIGSQSSSHVNYAVPELKVPYEKGRGGGKLFSFVVKKDAVEALEMAEQELSAASRDRQKQIKIVRDLTGGKRDEAAKLLDEWTRRQAALDIYETFIKPDASMEVVLILSFSSSQLHASARPFLTH